jgi:hypothetical protein
LPDGDVLTRAELLARVDRAWRDLRERVRHLGRARLAERTATGWTYKDLVGHMAAWEEEAARGLRALRDGGEVPTFGSGAAVDAFNERAVRERRLVGPEAILDELEAAHRQLVRVIEALPEALLADARAQRWIAGNTYNHYAEHDDELGAFTAR